MRAIASVAIIAILVSRLDAFWGGIAIALAIVWAIVEGGRQGSSDVATISRMPTRYEQARRRRRSRWVPGIGIGVSLWHGVVPFFYVTLHRWGRR
jgi:hypothetical protein